MQILKYLVDRYDLVIGDGNPFEIPDVGRNTMATWLHDVNFQTGVEVGVAAGEYSKILCDFNPQMKLTGIDPWEPYRGYRDYTRGTTFNLLEETARKLLTSYPNYEFLKAFSVPASCMFADNSLDFVYIDANHSDPYVTEDITAWFKKVKSGGVLAGHDYSRPKGTGNRPLNWGVKDAVQKYTRDNNISPWFVLGSSAKLPGMIRDDSRSWMIIKP